MKERLNSADRLRRLLASEIRPGLRDPHPERRQRFRMQERVVVDLLRNQTPVRDGIRSRILALSERKPWRTPVRKMLAFRGRSTWLVEEDERLGGQLRWDLTAAMSPLPRGDGDHFSEVCSALREVLGLYGRRPGLSPEVRMMREELLFLMRLDDVLSDEGR